MAIGRAPLVLGTFKIATRPSAWARRPKRKPQPGEDTALFTESDGVQVYECPHAPTNPEFDMVKDAALCTEAGSVLASHCLAFVTAFRGSREFQDDVLALS